MRMWMWMGLECGSQALRQIAADCQVQATLRK